MHGPRRKPLRGPEAMLIQQVRRRLSRELAAYFVKRKSRSAVQGRQVSICFDDFPHSAASVGGDILQGAGARGTYYFSAGLCNRPSPVGHIVDLDTVRALADRGHEIGCHTFAHNDATLLSRDELKASLEANQRAVDFCKFESFAFPFGYWDWGSKKTASERFKTVRTAIKGINEGHADLAGLKSVPLYEGAGREGVDHWFKLLEKTNGWLIFYTHDVQAQPSRFGCTPDLLAYCLKQAAQLGCRVETVGMAASRLD